MSEQSPVPSRIAQLDLSPYEGFYAESPGELDRRLAAVPSSRTGMDFRHGDVSAFRPPAWTGDLLRESVAGAVNAYTPYRGNWRIRGSLADSLTKLMGVDLHPDRNVVITPGTQAGLFAALSSLVEAGDTVLVADPDYFFSQRIVNYLGAKVVPIPIRFDDGDARLDLAAIEAGLVHHPKVLLFSHPNNPTGAIYDKEMIDALADLVVTSGLMVVVDQLYSRLIYDGRQFEHLIARPDMVDRCITLMGPSKTESMSGFRLGCAVGAEAVIDRMEAVLSITALRAPGYNQVLLSSWMKDDGAWLRERIEAHQELRDLVCRELRQVDGVRVNAPRGGSYAFPDISGVPISDFDFAVRLRSEAGIAVNPGYQFGRAGCGHFRINYSQDRDGLKAALKEIVRVLGDSTCHSVHAR